MFKLNYRVATMSDRDSLNRVKREASLVGDEYREALLAHPEFLAVSDEQLGSGHILVAEDEGAIIGLAAVSRREDGLEFDGLFVDPAYWRRGVGRFLLESSAVHFSAGVGEALHVVASPEAKPFYLACGFKTMGTTETEFSSAVLMRRDE